MFDVNGEPSREEIRDAVSRAMRVCRLVDPDDGTVPFFLADGNLVWVSSKQSVDTITHAVVNLWRDRPEG